MVTLLMIGPKGANPWSIEATVPEASALVQAIFVRASQSHYQPMADRVPDANLFSQAECPSLIETPEMYYPNFMQVRGRQGEVWAEYVVREDGTVDPGSFIAILSDGDSFTQAFRDAIAKARFRPARVNGAPVARRVSQRMTFRLR
jgi:TonB family protein